MSGVTGDFAGLESIIGRLEGMRDLAEDIAIESSIAIEGEIDNQFTLGCDPYGEPWAPLAESTKRRHHRDDPALTASGAMRASVVVQATQANIEVIVADPAGYHQEGTEYMPARHILPPADGPIPPAWDAAVHEAGERVMAKRWGKVST